MLKALKTLLRRRIPSWPRLCGVQAVLKTRSLEELRVQISLADKRSKEADENRPAGLVSPFDLRPPELARLITALYRDSINRSALLKEINARS